MKQPGIVMVAPDDLKAWPGNPRIHGDDVDFIVKSMERFGFTNPILAQRGTNRVIAGHGRLMAAKRKGFEKVPVVFLDLDDAAATAYTIADNRLPELSSWDFPALKEQLVELDSAGFDVSIVWPGDLEALVVGPDEDEEQGDPEEVKVQCPFCRKKFVPKGTKK